MPVNSYLELVLTTFGWHLYDLIWNIMADTGLAYIPFLAVIIKNFIEPIESQEAKSAAKTSLRRLEVDIIRIVVVIFIAVAPFFAISNVNQTLTTACGFPPADATNRINQVFGEQIIGDDRVAKIPPWFYLVMTISGGINNSIISNLPCNLNIRQLQMSASTFKIMDVKLKGEVNRFVAECYVPARSEYFYGRSKIDDEEKIAWIGSRFFLENNYKKLYSRGPVPGFAVNLSRESDAAQHSPPPMANPVAGYPRCDEWWNGAENGLRARLLAQYPADWAVEFRNMFNDREATDDAAVRKLLQNEAQSGYQLDLTNAPSFGVDNVSIVGVGQGAVEWFGGVVTAATISFVTNMIVRGAPYVQAFALFGVYFLLPLVLIFGNYEWSVIKTASIYIFAIKFWSSIWAVVALIDDKLTTALTVRDGLHPIDYLSITAGFDAIIASIMTAALYISLPTFMMMMLAWAGERGASVGNQMSTAGTSATKSAGSAGAGIAKSGAGKMTGPAKK